MAFLTDPPAVLSTDTIEVYDSCDVHVALNLTYENLVSTIEYFKQRGSGLILDKLISLDLHLLEFDPLRATSYIPLPACIQNRKAVINIKNKDEKCFLWSVIAGLYGDTHAENHERLSHYLEYEKEFNLPRCLISNGFKGYSKIRKIECFSICLRVGSRRIYIPVKSVKGSEQTSC